MALDYTRKTDYSAIPGGKTAPPAQQTAGNIANNNVYDQNPNKNILTGAPFGATKPKPPMTAPSAPAAGGAAASPYGSQSGPGILENWFNQRANGTDPAYEYAMKRGMQSLGNQSAAAGNFNSGAARQQESDFAANMGAQRLGQLDALAGGASGEHQGRLNSMFNQGLGLANGQSGINSAYDLAAGKSMSDALSALLGYTTNKAGVDSQANQGLVNNGLKLVGSIYGGG